MKFQPFLSRKEGCDNKMHFPWSVLKQGKDCFDIECNGLCATKIPASNLSIPQARFNRNFIVWHFTDLLKFTGKRIFTEGLPLVK